MVNEDFVRVVLGGRSPLGRRLRYVGSGDPDREPPQYEIVGVMRQIAMNTDPKRHDSPGVYHPLARAGMGEFHLIMGTPGSTASFAPRLQALAAGGMAVLLSTSGIYAIMSFSVSRRTREIGVRVALGAGGVQVASAVAGRTLRQIAIGVVTGGLIAQAVLVAFRASVQIEPPISVAHIGLFFLYVAVTTGVCLLAAIVPTRRRSGSSPRRR